MEQGIFRGDQGTDSAASSFGASGRPPEEKDQSLAWADPLRRGGRALGTPAGMMTCSRLELGELATIELDFDLTITGFETAESTF